MERKLELVNGEVYDELATAATACRARIDAFLPFVAELAGSIPHPPDWVVLYESLRGRVRLLLLKAAGPPAREMVGTTSSPETTVVWSCPDCGGLEETQPCIGVCIWRPVDWVELSTFESTRAQLLRDIELDRALFGLLTRFARAKPRRGEWERNWGAFQGQARLVLGQRLRVACSETNSRAESG